MMQACASVVAKSKRCAHRLEEELREAMLPYETAATPLGSFPALFQQAMSLGLLSRRRVFAEAQQSIGAPPGFLQQLAGASRAVMSRNGLFGSPSCATVDRVCCPRRTKSVAVVR